MRFVYVATSALVVIGATVSEARSVGPNSSDEHHLHLDCRDVPIEPLEQQLGIDHTHLLKRLSKPDEIEKDEDLKKKGAQPSASPPSSKSVPLKQNPIDPSSHQPATRQASMDSADTHDKAQSDFAKPIAKPDSQLPSPSPPPVQESSLERKKKHHSSRSIVPSPPSSPKTVPKPPAGPSSNPPVPEEKKADALKNQDRKPNHSSTSSSGSRFPQDQIKSNNYSNDLKTPKDRTRRGLIEETNTKFNSKPVGSMMIETKEASIPTSGLHSNLLSVHDKLPISQHNDNNQVEPDQISKQAKKHESINVRVSPRSLQNLSSMATNSLLTSKSKVTDRKTIMRSTTNRKVQTFPTSNPIDVIKASNNPISRINKIRTPSENPHPSTNSQSAPSDVTQPKGKNLAVKSSPLDEKKPKLLAKMPEPISNDKLSMIGSKMSSIP